MIEIVLLLAWLFTHALYRGVVGTVCTFKKVDPPWVRSRQERLTNREVRRADRKAVLESKRTARGFIARLWGDLWQDAHAWQDESREAKQKRREEQPEGKPVVSVDADQAAEWARNLGNRVKAAWNRWWGPSQKQCPWLTVVLNADHTQVEGQACGQHVRRKDTYCLPHQTFADLGHCLWGNGSPDMPQCMSPRHGHYPFCLPHVEEWGNDTADREAAAAPAAPDAPQVGTLDTPDTPELAGVEMTDEQRQLAAKLKDTWQRGELVEPGPTPAEWFALPVSVRADLLKVAESGGIRIDTTFAPDDRAEQEPESAPADTSPATDTAEIPPQDGTTEAPPQRPVLRVVPPHWAETGVREEDMDANSDPATPNTQGDTAMTTPATGEITNVQALKTFAEKVQAHGSNEWPSMLEAAESQMGAAGLNNDPALTATIGQMREAAGMFAAAGAALQTALTPHEATAEQVSGLGSRAADNTATYQNQ